MNSAPADVLTLRQKSSESCIANGAEIVARSEDASRFLSLWIEYLQLQRTGTADCLLSGASSAIRESVACLCLGLARPALHSLRLQIDLILGWLYFKDHPVEWHRIDETGDGYKMKKEIIKYLDESFKQFSPRFGILKECRIRGVEDPYRLLSAHIHGQSQYVLPVVISPSDIVSGIETQREVVLIQSDCSEFIGDILWSVYADRWASLPEVLRSALVCRFKTDKQRVAFFDS